MSSLRKEMAKGVMWTAVAKYSGILIQILISMVLARLIAPEEFGVVAIAQVAISFVSVLADMGIGAGVIQNKTLNERDYDSLFTFSIILAIIIALVIIGMSPFLASFYKDSKLVPICIMISVSSLFSTMDMVPGSLFYKEKRFKFIAKRTLAFQVLSGCISVTYAFLGGGCFALVLAPIISSLGTLLISLKEYPRRIDWHFRLDPIRKIFSFSVFQFLFNLVNYFSRNLDKLIIGKALNLRELGYYQKSYNLMLMPLQNITFVITPVLQPFLSDFQNDLDFIKEKYLEIIKLIATLSFPLGVVLYFIAYEIIYILYGPQWLPAVPAFEIFAWSIPFQMIFSTVGSIYQSTNHTKTMFYSGFMNTSITIIGFVICAFCNGGMNGFALAWDITLILNFMTSFYIMFHFVFDSGLKLMFKRMIHPLINCVSIFILCSIVNLLVGKKYIALSLSLKLIASLTSTILVISIFKDYDLKSLCISIKNTLRTNVR